MAWNRLRVRFMWLRVLRVKGFKGLGFRGYELGVTGYELGGYGLRVRAT